MGTTGPGQAGMSEPEWLLVQTRHRAAQLALALLDAPFAEETFAELRSYLEDAEAVVAAFRTVLALPAHERRARIEALVADGAAVRTEPDARRLPAARVRPALDRGSR